MNSVLVNTDSMHFSTQTSLYFQNNFLESRTKPTFVWHQKDSNGKVTMASHRRNSFLPSATNSLYKRKHHLILDFYEYLYEFLIPPWKSHTDGALKIPDVSHRNRREKSPPPPASPIITAAARCPPTSAPDPGTAGPAAAGSAQGTHRAASAPPVTQHPPLQPHHRSIVQFLMKTLQALATVLELGKHMHFTEIFATRN